MAWVERLNCWAWGTPFQSAHAGNEGKSCRSPRPPQVKLPLCCVSGILYPWCGMGGGGWGAEKVNGRQLHGPADAGLNNQAAAPAYATKVGRSDRALWLTLNGLAGSCWKPCPAVSFPWPFWKRRFLCLAQEFFSPVCSESGVAGLAGQWWLCSIVAF